MAAQKKTAAKKPTALQKAKSEIQDLKLELDMAKARVSKKDFYQGLAWGAGIGAFIVLLGVLLF